MNMDEIMGRLTFGAYAGCLVLLGIGAIAQLSGPAYAKPRGALLVAPTSRNEGNTAADFAVTCSSTAWTLVKAANENRRSLYVQAMPANSYAVCVSTYNTSTVTCGDTTVGVEFPAGSEKTFYGEEARYCRARALSTGEYLKGSESYDDRD